MGFVGLGGFVGLAGLGFGVIVGWVAGLYVEDGRIDVLVLVLVLDDVGLTIVLPPVGKFTSVCTGLGFTLSIMGSLVTGRLSGWVVSNELVLNCDWKDSLSEDRYVLSHPRLGVGARED